MKWSTLERWRPWDQLPDDVSVNSLDAFAHKLQALTRPCEKDQIAVEVEALRLHYPEWDNFSEGQIRRMARDTVEDFRGYPFALLKLGCFRWRNSPAKRPPTSGQLKAMVDTEFRMLRHMTRQVENAKVCLASGECTG